ncbi:MAG: TonB-dependent receptor [Bacteroidales bacterium]|nr:TonB-dependent receptor [Bacteroidales bacterium]
MRRFCVFIYALIAGASLYGQDLPERIITLRLDRVQAEQALDTLTRMTGLEFAYESSLLASKKISLELDRASVRETLDQLSERLDMTWKVIGNQVIFRRREPDRKPGKNHKVSGIIRDGASGETLIGAHVYVASQATGTVSNEYGFYSLSLPSGNYGLEYSYTGFIRHLQRIDLESDLDIVVSLMPDESLLAEVVVVPEENPVGITRPGIQAARLRPQEIKGIPALMGEPDVVKTLQMLPGITMLYEGASTFYVRGGDRDQNLILLDDAPVYNPSHLFGLFSAFDQQAVKEATIMKADIPAWYGGRLSSVLDIRMNDGNMKQTVVSGSMGLISGRLSLEGPVARDRSSFMISARRSLFDLYLRRLSGESIDEICFYDLSGKINLRINRNNRLFLSVYTGNDVYTHSSRQEDFNGINWFNNLTSLRWNHIFGPVLFSNTTLCYSTYQYYLGQPAGRNLVWHSSISAITLKSDLSWFPDTRNTVRFGYGLTAHEINPGVLERNRVMLESLPHVQTRRALEHAFYFSNGRQMSEKLKMEVGVRIPVFQNLGAEDVYVFDASYAVVDTLSYARGGVYHTEAGLEPRLGISYSPGKQERLYAAYEHHHQFLQLVSGVSGSLTSVEVWLPSGLNLESQSVRQFSAGYQRQLGKGWQLSMETYHKWFRNLLEYSDHAQIFLNSAIEGELRSGKGCGYGVEIALSRETGRVTGMASYTFSRTERLISDINNGKPYPSLYDRPHVFHLLFSWTVSRRSLLSLNWTATTGSPFTSPEGFYYYQNKYVPIYGSRNNDRFPAYRRMDVSYTLRTDPSRDRRFRNEFTVGVFNLSARKNPVSVSFSKIEDTDGGFVMTNDLARTDDRLVTYTYLFSFIPYITYSFRF